MRQCAGFVLAKTDIEDYAPQGLNDDYFQGEHFLVKKGAILAKTPNVKIEFSDEFEKSRGEDLIEFRKDENSHGGDVVRADFSGEKITVSLGKKLFELCEKLNMKRNRCSGILRTQRCLPVLIGAVAEIARNATKSEESDLLWQCVFKRKLDSKNSEIDWECVEPCDFLKYANQLLDDGLFSAFAELDQLTSADDGSFDEGE